MGFTIAPGREEGNSDPSPVFHLYHKKTLFYSFKAEDTSAAQRYGNVRPTSRPQRTVLLVTAARS